MIDNLYGEVRIVCDNCDEATELYDKDDFKQMVKDAKDNGWVIEKDEEDRFVHWCPDCK